MIVRIKGETWDTQIIKRLKWYMHIGPNYAPEGAGPTPPMWAIPLNGWITDPEVILETIYNDPDLKIKVEE